MQPGFSFHVIATEGASRAGVLRTPHGDVDTPAFMPVATLGAVSRRFERAPTKSSGAPFAVEG